MGVLSVLTGFLSGGDVVKDIGNVLDNLHTSGEEKAAAEIKIKEILTQAEQAAQQQVSARWEADMKHGSWLSKNKMFGVCSSWRRHLSFLQIHGTHS